MGDLTRSHFESLKCSGPRRARRAAKAGQNSLESVQRIIWRALTATKRQSPRIRPCANLRWTRPNNQLCAASRVRLWFAHLWREWTIESWRPISPAFAKPKPFTWNDARLTAAWIGHATVLINFFGIKILTDPVLFPRVGIRLPGLTIGPKRLTAPALEFHELPRIDIVILSHAHFDHFDLRTLHRFDKDTSVVTAPNTADLLSWTRLRDITELRWGETKLLNITGQTKGEIAIRAFQVKHWGARKQHDDYRGYNGYLIERNGRRILFAGDTAMTDSFTKLRRSWRNRSRDHVNRRL